MAVRVLPRNMLDYPIKLLIFSMGGKEFLYGEDVVATSRNGEDIVFQPGLDIGDVISSVDLFSNTFNGNDVSIQLSLKPEDYEAFLLNQEQIFAASAVVYLYFGGDFEDGALEIASGILSDFAWGDPDRPKVVSFSIGQQIEDTALIPTIRADELSWDSLVVGAIDDDAIGQFYPLIIGRPGYNAASVAGVVKGAPCCAANVATALASDTRLVLCSGRVATTGGIKLWSSNNKSGVVDLDYGEDDHGNLCTWAEMSSFSGTYGDFIDFPPYMVGWSGYGIPGPTGEGIQGLGDCIIWALQEARLRNLSIDWARLYAKRLALNALGRVDTYITTQVSPWEWLSNEVLPYFPVYIGIGSGGLYIDIVPLAPSSKDVRVTIDTANPGYTRAAMAEYNVEQIANDITVSGQLNPVTNQDAVYYRFSGDRRVYTSEEGVTTTAGLQKSFGLFGTRVQTYSVPVVQDPATLQSIGMLQALRYALPSVSVSYWVPWREGIYEPGSVCSITDSAIGFSNRLGILTSRAYTDGNCRVSAWLYPN